MPRVISKANEYRANAAECRRRAECSENAPEKHMWRDMSESWLGMIDFAEQEDFAAEEHECGTNQRRSQSSHWMRPPLLLMNDGVLAQSRSVRLEYSSFRG
jgi:hypothetical protein